MRSSLVSRASSVAWCVASSVACGGAAPPPPEAPRDPHATEHREAAEAHAARAAELARLTDALGGPTDRIEDAVNGLWMRSLAEERAASEHVAEAERIEHDAAVACEGMTDEQKRRSPIQRFAIAWLPKPEGIVVLLPTSAGAPDQLVAELRCHRAWMQLGQAPGDQCPLDLGGVDLVVYGDRHGISVELTPRDHAQVPELQRRTEYVIAHGQHARPR